MKKLLLTIFLLFSFTQLSNAQTNSGAMFEIIVESMTYLFDGYQVHTPDLDQSEVIVLQIMSGHDNDTVIMGISEFVVTYSDTHYSQTWSEYNGGIACILENESTFGYKYMIWYIEDTDRMMVAKIDNRTQSL